MSPYINVRPPELSGGTRLPLSRHLRRFYLSRPVRRHVVLESWKRRASELEAEVYALYLAYRDPRTPVAAKAVILALVAYAVSPIDPIPDFVPGLGYLDELVLLPLGVALALRLVPDDVLDECRSRADEEIDAGRARWIVAGITVLLWALLAVLALRTFQ